MFKSINLYTIEVSVGKCHLNLKTDGQFAVSLQIGKNISSLSHKNSIVNNLAIFNTTLRMHIDKQYLQHEAGWKCRVLLHMIRQNRERQVIGISTIDVEAQNNKGFKYHELGQCADNQADIELAVSCYSAFQIGAKSEIGINSHGNSRLKQKKYLGQYKDKDSFIQDSIFDNSGFNLLNRSKTLSNTQFKTLNQPLRPVKPVRSRRNSNLNSVRSIRPQDLICKDPQHIINHYETQIKTLQEEIRQRDTWGNGMKLMIQQLQAQNQLLKEIKIEQLQQSNIQNLDQGIQFVSKIVHSRFQESRSRIIANNLDAKSEFESPGAFQEKYAQTEQKGHFESRITEDLRLDLNQDQINLQQSESKKFNSQTNPYKGMIQIIVSPRMQQIPKESQNLQSFLQSPGDILQNRQQLIQALNMLTGGQNNSQSPEINTRINELQQNLFKVRQQKQQLQDIIQELQGQLLFVKQERDSYHYHLGQLEIQLDRVNHYLEQVEEENFRLKEVDQKIINESKDKLRQNGTDNNQLSNENKQLQEKINKIQQNNTELQRKLDQSLKAIRDLKNDALSYRQELIMKEEQLSTFRTKFEESRSLTDNLMKNQKATRNEQAQQNKKENHKNTQITQIYNASTNILRGNLHQLYYLLLQTSGTQRKELHDQFTKIISSKCFIAPPNSQQISQDLRQLQNLINKLFVQIFKNTSQFKNIKQIQVNKRQITRKLQSIMASK